MKFFIIEGSALENHALSESAKAELKEQHLAYFGEATKAGNMLLNGPKVDAVGGCMVFKAESAEKAREFFDGDPHAIAGIREYKIIEFKPAGCQDFLKEWFELE